RVPLNRGDQRILYLGQQLQLGERERVERRRGLYAGGGVARDRLGRNDLMAGEGDQGRVSGDQDGGQGAHALLRVWAQVGVAIAGEIRQAGCRRRRAALARSRVPCDTRGRAAGCPAGHHGRPRAAIFAPCPRPFWSKPASTRSNPRSPPPRAARTASSCAPTWWKGARRPVPG